MAAEGVRPSGEQGLRLLLVEDNSGDVDLVRLALGPVWIESGLRQVMRRSDALAVLAGTRFDTVLLRPRRPGRGAANAGSGEGPHSPGAADAATS